MATQSTFTWHSFHYQKPTLKSFNTAIFCKTKPSLRQSSTIMEKRIIPTLKTERLTASAAPEALTADSSTSTETETPSIIISQETEKAEVVVKQFEKPRLVLKFIWMEKNIGLALDQVIPGHGTVPLSPYFFWPRKDAWEELKSTLESKPWISQKKMIILLNQATDIINLWQQSGGNLS
ncbi:30S ribosomal protein 3-1, chloroplastic-like [Durio zibethinus]|uniref:30S ribosomal protein 3-1, chloroplastic-like n=1 Tax=Durio zibethinus TaxID=66656 RepID=A0A6P5XEX2_DURZI|nr:30S ribosomal protein 3-1, chloroplastic-like [Durio zibethinus]